MRRKSLPSFNSIQFRTGLEVEEADEERNTSTSNGKARWALNRGLRLGKQILVAGFVASSAPLLLPPLVLGLAVSMPYVFFLATHACTQSLMSKLLPTPPLLLPQNQDQDQGDIDDIDIHKQNQALPDETNTQIEMLDVEKNMASRNGYDYDYGQGVVNKYEPQLSHPQHAVNVIQDNGSVKEEEKASPQKHNNVKLGVKLDDGMEGHPRGESNVEQPMIVGPGVVTTIQGLDKIGNEIEEFKTPLEVTTVVLEEFGDQIQAIEGDIEEAELQRETKGLLEKTRDEARTDDNGGEYVKETHGGTNESDQKMGPVVENMEIALEDDKRSCTIGGTTEGDVRKEEDPNVCEEMLQSRNAETKDTIYNEVESVEPIRGMLKGKEVDNTNDSRKPMAEPSELLDGRRFFRYEKIPAEPVGDLLIEMQDYNTSVAEDSSEVTSEKTDVQIIVKQEPKPLLDEPTRLQKEILDNNISDFVNQESQLHAYNEIIDSSDADARQIVDEESSNVMVDEHKDPMEVLVSSVEHKSWPCECSSGKDIWCPSHEVVFNEENIWKQIHVIRQILGYEGTKQASCADELQALYIFTGVEPPTFLNENSCDLAEINEKLHCLMSLVGIKSNVA